MTTADDHDDGPTDAFIIARLAQWAGDFSFATELYRRVSKPLTSKVPDLVSHPLDHVRHASDLRARQISQKRGEFNRLVEESEVSTDPPPMTSKSVRGVVWRISERQFELRAYPKSIEALRTVLWAAARRREEDSRGDTNALASLGGKWRVPGDPFVEVAVSDFGQVSAELYWTEDTPPSGDLIESRFREVLDEFA
ncbi:MAG: hypothetical protein IT348_04385 [Candidatus Eisenbacteria bacterium]|nr:hypothetical protein [Candidatus Eisenbacteria bacterium]